MDLTKTIKELYQKYKSRELHQKYREGYNLGKELGEMLDLYGRENFLKRNINPEDEDRLFDIQNGLRHMYGEGGIESFFMFWGFNQHKAHNNYKKWKKNRMLKDEKENENN